MRIIKSVWIPTAALIIVGSAMSQQNGKQDQPSDGEGAGGMMQMMTRCMDECRAASQAMRQMNTILAEAERSGDPQRLRDTTDQARDMLADSQQRLSSCMMMMNQMMEMDGRSNNQTMGGMGGMMQGGQSGGGAPSNM